MLQSDTRLASNAPIEKPASPMSPPLPPQTEREAFLDICQPLFPQLLNASFSKETYLIQVHKPRYYRDPVTGRPGSAPLFGNSLLELLSKTPWYAVPTIWGPLILAAFLLVGNELKLGGAVSIHESPSDIIFWGRWMFAFILWGVGLAAWTLIEYALHRGLFHIDSIMPDHAYAFTAHFILHGIHHFMPMDQLRLVMPPIMTLLIATPFWFLTLQIVRSILHIATISPARSFVIPNIVSQSDEIAMLVFSGVMSGYVIYDLTHYFLHHKKLPAYYLSLKKYHLQHHFQDYHNGFGVSNRFWDRVFGTELGKPASLDIASPQKKTDMAGDIRS